MEHVDSDTGEVTEITLRIPAGPMPASIAKAVVGVMGDARTLGFDERNGHGGYNYASIDKFLASLRPLCANHGLIILLNEAAIEFRMVTNDTGKVSNWLDVTYHVDLYSAEGEHFGPTSRRVIVPAVGAQAFGSAESYVLKRFMRNLFQIPTGEKDADAEEGKPLPEGGGAAKRQGAGATKAAGGAQAAPATNGAQAASQDGAQREEMTALYRGLRAGIAAAPHKTALNSLIETATRDGRLEKLKTFSEKGYDEVMASVQKRLDMLNQPQQQDEEIPA